MPPDRLTRMERDLVIARAGSAVAALRDATREGRMLDFRQRDPLIAAIHETVDALDHALTIAERERDAALAIISEEGAVRGLLAIRLTCADCGVTKVIWHDGHSETLPRGWAWRRNGLPLCPLHAHPEAS